MFHPKRFSLIVYVNMSTTRAGAPDPMQSVICLLTSWSVSANFCWQQAHLTSTSIGRLIVVTWYFMFAFGLIYVCGSALEWLGMGHHPNETRINAWGQNGATIRVTFWAVIEVRPAAPGQIWHPPESHK